MVQYEIVVHGRVQGVGFRYFVQKKANELGIKGWVRNRPDGSVQAVAIGDENSIQTFIGHLETGPALSRVDNLSKYKSDKLSDFDTFKVKY